MDIVNHSCMEWINKQRFTLRARDGGVLLFAGNARLQYRDGKHREPLAIGNARHAHAAGVRRRLETDCRRSSAAASISLGDIEQQ